MVNDMLMTDLIIRLIGMKRDGGVGIIYEWSRFLGNSRAEVAAAAKQQSMKLYT